MKAHLPGSVVMLLVLTQLLASTSALAQKKNDAAANAAVSRQADQIRKLSEGQQRLQEENTRIAAEKNKIEEAMKESQSQVERTRSAARQSESRLGVIKRDLAERDAKLVAAAAEIQRAQIQSQELAARHADLERVAGQQRDRLSQLENALRARDAGLVQALSKEREQSAKIEDCSRKNAEMASASNEILAAIDRSRMGEVLLGAEPVVGFKRVRVESLIQEYRDRIDDGRLREASSNPR